MHMFMLIHVAVSETSFAVDFSPLVQGLLMFFSNSSLICHCASLPMSPSYRGRDCCFLHFLNITFCNRSLIGTALFS